MAKARKPEVDMGLEDDANYEEKKRKRSEDDDIEGDGDEPEDEGEEEDVEVDDEEREDEEREDIDDGNGGIVRRGPKKRGRKKTKLTMSEDGAFYDEEGNLLKIENDEVVIDNEDPQGRTKIDEFGNLQGARKFRNKTFTVLGQGERKYMVSTEPARLVGFRDSYLLFKTHTNLFKKVCTNEEKTDLIDRHIIPTSYKGRSVNLVTARSIYREFGAKILVDGKKVIDDFWEQRARDNGDIEGEYADPSELYNYNIATSGVETGANTMGHLNNQQTSITGAAAVSYLNDPTWQYLMALKTREFNNKLASDRSITYGGVKDVYTGLMFLPSGTQSSKSRILQYKEYNGPKDTTAVDVVFTNPNIKRKYVGLNKVSKDVLDKVEDDDVKSAIVQQIEYESSL